MSTMSAAMRTVLHSQPPWGWWTLRMAAISVPIRLAQANGVANGVANASVARPPSL